MLYIGIDPGTHTGVAVWDSDLQKLTKLMTLPLHKALSLVYNISRNNPVHVIFEDARKRTWYGGNAHLKMQGAGSIKRDCTIWEEFCRDNGIEFTATAPARGCTKWDEDYFTMMTGWTGRTSNHARDAALLVMGR